MQRQQTLFLEVHTVRYAYETETNTPSSSGFLSRKNALKALKKVDGRGRFSIRGYEEMDESRRPVKYEGRVIRVKFQGKRKLTRSELDDIPFEPDNKFSIESVAYSFEQWRDAGRPLRLWLLRTEEYVSQ